METAVENRKETYLKRVEELYGLVEKWFRKLDPGARIERGEDVLRNELAVGEYRAPTMIVRPTTGYEIRLEPIACDVASAAGWVEIWAPGCHETLAYLEENPVIRIGVGEGERIVSLRDQTGTGWAWARNKLKRDLPSLDEATFRALVAKLRG